MARPKLPTKPSKKSKAAAEPTSADDYQAQADEEESRGGKWRAGDPTKSARAFQRALTFYDQGLQRFPTDFDLAYNRARLQLELSQQPSALSFFGVNHADFLAETLQAHRRALALNDGEVDLLFNTAQVLSSLAEELSSAGRELEAVPLLHEALELLSSCLAKQEMMQEQQSMEALDDEDEGGVPVGDASDSPEAQATEEVTATVIQPIAASDLLDTVHASLSALTTLLALEQEHALTNLGGMAQTLVDTKAAAYVALLPADEQASARFTVAIDRAIFTAALANARFGFHDMDLKTYMDALRQFDIQGKEQHAQALSHEAEAKAEMVLSALDRPSDDMVVECWRQLSQAQELLAQATKLEDEDSKELRPQLYRQKGDLELLRTRLASLPSPDVTESMRGSAPALLKNARTFYKAAIGYASAAGDDDAASTASDRMAAVQFLLDLNDERQPSASHGLAEVLSALVEEGLLDSSLLERIYAMSAG